MRESMNEQPTEEGPMVSLTQISIRRAPGMRPACSQPSVKAAPFPTSFLTVPSPFLGMKCGVIERALGLESKTLYSLTHNLEQVT